MQVTPRALALAVALLASTPLLAASSGASWNDEPDDSASPAQDLTVTAMPAGASTAWLPQDSFLEGSRGAAAPSTIPARAGIQLTLPLARLRSHQNVWQLQNGFEPSLE